MGLITNRSSQRARNARRVGVFATIAFASITFGFNSQAVLLAQTEPGKTDAPPAMTPQAGMQPAAMQPANKLGLSVNDSKAYQGYTLVFPLMNTKTYLVDMEGRVVRTWDAGMTPSCAAYLLPNGNLLRPGAVGGTGGMRGGGGPNAPPGGPGAGGKIQEYTFDGELVWDFAFSNSKQAPHHDVCKLPNGNVLAIIWDKKTGKEAADAGRTTPGDSLLPDGLIEVKPTGKTTGEIVWEWHAWDHLVQDTDPKKPNYGKINEHPELIDINYGEAIVNSQQDVDRLRGIGYLGNTNPAGPGGLAADWTHLNAVCYNAELDQIMISSHAFSEFWIIDHSTTTAEAASHKGGKSGKGGDLLYRWGNPAAYQSGKAADQRLYAQHNAQWIEPGLPGAGNILVFNNGRRRPGGSNYSSIDELVPPVDSNGRYPLATGSAYGPEAAISSYTTTAKTDFYSELISGTQKLPNGNLLICIGTTGVVFEVTPKNEVVWKYVNPVPGGPGGGRGPRGIPGGGVPGGLGMGRGPAGPGMGRGGLGAPGFGTAGPGGGPTGTSLFRAYRYGADYAAFKGKDLTPGKTIEETLAAAAPAGPGARSAP